MAKSTSLYRYFNANDELIYVGISINHVARLADHRQADAWFGEIARISVENHSDRKSALAAETHAIKTEHPKYNKYKKEAHALTVAEDVGDLFATEEEALKTLKLRKSKPRKIPKQCEGIIPAVMHVDEAASYCGTTILELCNAVARGELLVYSWFRKSVFMTRDLDVFARNIQALKLEPAA